MTRLQETTGQEGKQVRPTMRTDTDIQQDVLRALNEDPRLDDATIRVTVDRGVVTLTGTVGSHALKLAAQEAAHQVHDVHDVANDVRVQAPDPQALTDTMLAHEVRRALEWHVRVPDERIRSTVSDGWVTLDGTVEFPHERADAERAVSQITGVCGVTNNIEVEVPPVTRYPGCRALPLRARRRFYPSVALRRPMRLACRFCHPPAMCRRRGGVFVSLKTAVRTAKLGGMLVLRAAGG